MSNVIEFPKSVDEKVGGEVPLPDFLVEESEEALLQILEETQTPSLPENSEEYKLFMSLLSYIYGEVFMEGVTGVHCRQDDFSFTRNGEKHEIIGTCSVEDVERISGVIKDSVEKEGYFITGIKNIILDSINSRIVLFFPGTTENLRIPFSYTQNRKF